MSLRFAAFAGCGALIVATGALAQSPITWVEAPSVADVAAAYPAKAKAAGLGGGVELTCEIARTGHPKDCEALGKSPPATASASRPASSPSACGSRIHR